MLWSPEAFPEGSMIDHHFVPGEWDFFHLPYVATTSCCISQMPFLYLQTSVLLLSSLFQCCLPVQQSIHVLCPCTLATGRFQGRVFSWHKWYSSTEIQLFLVCACWIFMAYLMCKLKRTTFLCWHVRNRSLLLLNMEILDLHFLSAMKGTFKVLISIFTEFNSEGISACSA